MANPLQKPVPLNVGDALPEGIVLANAYNYPGDKISLDNFKGKLLLIDFWSTWCSSCIEGFSKMHELQKTFDSQIQIILVNTQKSDTQKKVNALFERRQQRTGTAITLPYVLQDSVLFSFFPHQFIPHYAWINGSGKIVAITSAEEVTEKNIRSVLNEENITLRTKKDLLDFDRQKPLFVDGNGGEAITPIYRSMITGYIEGIGGSTGVRQSKNGQLTGYYSYNKPLQFLLAEAFRHLDLYTTNRIIVEGNNTMLLQIKNGIKEDSENYYCYELVMPPGALDQALTFMQRDLLKTFNLTISAEKRKVKTLVLTAVKNISSSYAKGGDSEAAFEVDRVHKFLRNYSVKDMLWLVNSTFSLPVIDETGITKNIDMDLPVDMTSEEAWLKALEKAGFKATVTERELDMTVVTAGG